jgi:CDP-paratose 2-epimerase
MYGSRQFATSDQGWIGFFCEQFFRKPKNLIDIYGIGKQTRDILFSDDVVQLYYKAMDRFDVLKGEAFNIGGGAENSISLLELFDVLKEKTGNEIKYRTNTMRKSDQKVYISKINKISNAIEWVPDISLDAGLDLMLEWVRDK